MYKFTCNISAENRRHIINNDFDPAPEGWGMYEVYRGGACMEKENDYDVELNITVDEDGKYFTEYFICYYDGEDWASDDYANDILGDKLGACNVNWANPDWKRELRNEMENIMDMLKAIKYNYNNEGDFDYQTRDILMGKEAV